MIMIRAFACLSVIDLY